MESEKILLDTNMLLAAVQFHADIFAHGAFTLSSCVDELQKIAKKKSNAAMNARAVLKIIEKKCIPVSAASKKGDTAIVGYAAKHNCAVATNDKLLIEKLKQRKIKVYRLRQKKMLVEAYSRL